MSRYFQFLDSVTGEKSAKELEAADIPDLPASMDTETVQDIVGAMVSGVSPIGTTYNDGTNSLAVSLVSGGVADTHLGNRTIDDTTAAPVSDTGLLTELLSKIANRLKAITGASSWMTSPATTLAAASAHYAAVATSATLGHVKAGVVGSGISVNGAGELSVNTTTIPAGAGITNRITYWATGNQVDDTSIVYESTLSGGALGFGATPSLGIIHVVRADTWSCGYFDHTGGGAGAAVEGRHSTGTGFQGEVTTGFALDALATGSGGTGVRARATNANSTALQIDGNLNLVNEGIKTAAYTLQRSDLVLPVSTNPGAAFTVTLPALSTMTVGDTFLIEDVGGTLATRNVTLSRAGADVFKGGATTKALATNNGTWLLRVSQNQAGTKQWALHALTVV
jgi:hypothetical protein